MGKAMDKRKRSGVSGLKFWVVCCLFGLQLSSVPTGTEVFLRSL